MTDHKDSLSELNNPQTLCDKLKSTHKTIASQFPFVARIAVALFDADTGTLKTYVHSSGDDNPLEHYESNIDDAPSLKALLEKGLPRVINNMVTFENGKNEHTRRIGRQGYTASYTQPMFNEGSFIGFIFINSYEQDVFTENVLQQIDVYTHMISLMVINELAAINTLSAAVKTTNKITHMRDPETGCHLDRMSRYSRLIAKELASEYNLDDSYIEHIFMFSPLHDIGKIAIPDNILLKPGKLNTEERSVMDTHASKGREIIDDLLNNFGLHNINHKEMLGNIAEHHHEAVNGKGYPSGQKGEEIPLEARIVAVADVFDALTSERPYKKAWSNAVAINTLKEMAGEILDQNCVNALINNMDKVEEIQKQFSEHTYF